MPRLASQLTVAIAAQVALLGFLPQGEIRAATFRSQVVVILNPCTL